MVCQLCNFIAGEHSVAAQGICGYCAENLMCRLKELEEIVNRLVPATVEVAATRPDVRYGVGDRGSV